MFPSLCLNGPVGINVLLHISPCYRLLTTACTVLHIMWMQPDLITSVH
jgi:hypothetical protein